MAKQGRQLHSTTLTQTFRFGEAVGRVANSILHVKEHSEQTENALWVPYRVHCAADKESKVTDQPLAMPKTVIGRTNVALAIAAWDVMATEDEEAGARCSRSRLQTR